MAVLSIPNPLLMAATRGQATSTLSTLRNTELVHANAFLQASFAETFGFDPRQRCHHSGPLETLSLAFKRKPHDHAQILTKFISKSLTDDEFVKMTHQASWRSDKLSPFSDSAYDVLKRLRTETDGKVSSFQTPGVVETIRRRWLASSQREYLKTLDELEANIRHFERGDDYPHTITQTYHKAGIWRALGYMELEYGLVAKLREQAAFMEAGIFSLAHGMLYVDWYHRVPQLRATLLGAKDDFDKAKDETEISKTARNLLQDYFGTPDIPAVKRVRRNINPTHLKAIFENIPSRQQWDVALVYLGIKPASLVQLEAKHRELLVALGLSVFDNGFEWGNTTVYEQGAMHYLRNRYNQYFHFSATASPESILLACLSGHWTDTPRALVLGYDPMTIGMENHLIEEAPFSTNLYVSTDETGEVQNVFGSRSRNVVNAQGILERINDAVSLVNTALGTHYTPQPYFMTDAGTAEHPIPLHSQQLARLRTIKI